MKYIAPQTHQALRDMRRKRSEVCVTPVGAPAHVPLVYQLRELAAGRITRVDQLEQPVFAWR